MPQIRSMRANAIGLAAFGGVLGVLGIVMLLPGVRERVQDIYWFVSKVGFFMYLYVWGRTTFPRYRFDQLMTIGWKVLFPISLAVVILTALIGVRQEIFALVWR
jgi:NADH:ubiquinone oxidoreductase subunit H